MSNIVPINQPVEKSIGGSLQIKSMDDLSRLSKMLSDSGYFQDAKGAAQCGVKVLAGLEIGIGPFIAMSNIHIINGEPSIGANLMASAVKSSPKYNYKPLVLSDQVCKLEFFEKVDGKWESSGISEFSIEDAHKAGCKNLNKFPRNMLFARAISNGVRWYCPDVFNGAAVYTPEELNQNPASETIDADLVNYISAAQRKRLFAIAKGWTHEQIKDFLATQYQITSTKEIPTELYEEICTALETPPVQPMVATTLVETKWDLVNQAAEKTIQTPLEIFLEMSEKAESVEKLTIAVGWLKKPNQWKTVKDLDGIEAIISDAIAAAKTRIAEDF